MLTKFFTFLLDTLIYLFLQGPVIMLCGAFMAATRMLNICYRGTFMLRRWLKGEPRWQEHDALLGIVDPEKLAKQDVLYRVWLTHLVACDQCWAAQQDTVSVEQGLCTTGRDLYRAYITTHVALQTPVRGDNLQ
jgi:hypothetical protein